MTAVSEAYLAMSIIAAVAFALTVAYGVAKTNNPK